MIVADCEGDDPKVTCSCCSWCFGPVDYTMNRSKVCEVSAFHFQTKALRNQATCFCDDSNSRVSCDLGECLACDETMTFCGRTTESTMFIDDLGYPLGYQSSFQYTAGRYNTTVSSAYSLSPRTCTVSLDGEKCTTCYLSSCDDGFPSMTVDCGNVMSPGIGNDALTYSSCSTPDGGLLDVFGWIDRHAFVGCPLPVSESYFHDTWNYIQ